MILANAIPIFQPAMRIIETITNTNPAFVATTFDHDYLTGEIIRLIVPEGYGMTQANQLFGTIEVTGPNNFLIDIDTTQFDEFVIPEYTLLPSGVVVSQQYAQTIPFAESNDMLRGATKNVLPS